MNKLYLDAAEAVEFLSNMKPEGLWHLVAIDESNRVSRPAKAKPTSTSM